MRFLVLWRHVGRRVDEGKVRAPGGLFLTLLEQGIASDIWDGTEADEETVRNFLKESHETKEPIEELTGVVESMGINDEMLKGLGDD